MHIAAATIRANLIRNRTMLLAGLSAVAMAVLPGQALAQDQNPQTTAVEAADDGSIIVTARRREESLLDVPIAITAYTGAQLEQSGAIDITDISQTTPNVTLEASRATNSTLTAFIRGVGQQDPVAGFEQGVGLYLDDVYLNRPQASVLDIYEVEHRGTARAAGHALWPQHRGRRDQVRDQANS